MNPLIRIGSRFEIFPYRTVDALGFGAGRDGITGLAGGAASRARVVERPTTHGDFDIPGKLDSRIVSAKGTCIADSSLQLAGFGDVLSGVLAEGPAPVVFNYLGRTLWGIAKLAPGTKPEFVPDSWSLGGKLPRAAFQLQMKLDNPRLFAEEAEVDQLPKVATSSTLVNQGNFSATPFYRLTGARAGGYTIVGPGGRQFTVTRTLVAGEVHTIDMAEGFLRVNGVRVNGAVASGASAPWAIPGGGTGTATVPAGVAISGRLYSTFI